MTDPHTPDIVIRRDTAGRWLGTCLACGEQTRASAHKPLVEQWHKAHVAEATTIRPNRPRRTA